MKTATRFKLPAQPKVEQPINVALPNTTDLKMQAILATARAVENLSRALISTNVAVTISNNSVTCGKRGTGIAVSTPDSA